MTGQKENSIELDFSKLEQSDATGTSKYINGGRVYFEANIFGYHTSSFTTRGFFDKLGFVEPMVKDSGVRWALNRYVTTENIRMAAFGCALLLAGAIMAKRSSGEKKLH